MRVVDLQHLYDYHYWANGKLLGVVASLSAEQFAQDVAGSYGSVRNTLVHVLSAERGWLDRCGGPPRGEKLRGGDFPTPATLAAAWATVERSMREFLASLRDDDLAREVRFAFGNGPERAIAMGDLLQHVVVHAAHHRGQVALLLRLLDRAPGNVDLLIWAIQAPPSV